MVLSSEIQNKIKILFENDSVIREQLLSGDADAIRKIGSMSQKGINPEDIVAAFESNDPDTMNYLYVQSKRLIELHELYKELCYEFYKNTEHYNSKKRNI